MKILISVILLFILSYSYAWALPECEQSANTWHKCIGKYTFDNGDEYEGEWKENKLNGQGTYIFANNGDKYVGEYEDGKANGQGTYFHANGEKYIGEFKNGIPNGKGTYFFTNGDKYIGEFKNDLFNGQGTFFYAGGDKYVGENKDGKAHGKGTYYFLSNNEFKGDKYKGEFKDDFFHGKGTYFFADGIVWQGQWEDNKWLSGKKYAKGEYKDSKDSIVASNKCPGSPLKNKLSLIPSSWHNCQGIFVFTNEKIKNSKYIGEFKDGQMHKGTFYFLTENEFKGDKYVGEWKSNLFHGQGTYTYANGEKYVGEFKYQERHGQGTYTYANGDKYIGEYNNSKKHGQGTYTYVSGEKYVGEFKDNFYHGQGTFFHISGNKYEGEFKDDKRQGKGTYFFADGRVWDGQWENNEWVSGKKYAAGEYNGTVVTDKNNINKNDDKSEELIPAASGSGFIISESGHIVSNNHVIQGCEAVKAHHKGKSFEAILLATDTINDLALLQIDFSPSTVFSISQNNTELMQDVFVAGYPFGVSVSTSVKVTKGIVSSLAGVGNNYSNMQIDAALQPGNSGGPILDENGNVVGVAVAKLDLELAMEKFGVVPEGTNFGIKSSVLKNFLQSNSIDLKTPMKDKISRSDLSKKITDGTLFLSCWMTYAQIEKLKTQKVIFKELQ